MTDYTDVPIYHSKVLPRHWIVFLQDPAPKGNSPAVGVPDTATRQPTIDVNIPVRGLAVAIGLGPLRQAIVEAAIAHRQQ